MNAAEVKPEKSEPKYQPPIPDEALIDRDLRPCPFCGSPAQIEVHTSNEMKKNAPTHFDPQVRCLGDHCGLVWQLWGTGETDSFLSLQDAKEAMRAHWDRRTPEAWACKTKIVAYKDAQLDCPFCGGPAKLIVSRIFYADRDRSERNQYIGIVACQNSLCRVRFEDDYARSTVEEAERVILERWVRRTVTG